MASNLKILVHTVGAESPSQDHLAPFRGSWRRLQAARDAAVDAGECQPGGMFKSAADQAVDVSAYFNREG